MGKVIQGYTVSDPLIIDEETSEVLSTQEVKEYFNDLTNKLASIATSWLNNPQYTKQIRAKYKEKSKLKPQELVRQARIGSSQDMPTGYVQPYRLYKLASYMYGHAIMGWLAREHHDPTPPSITKKLEFGSVSGPLYCQREHEPGDSTISFWTIGPNQRKIRIFAPVPRRYRYMTSMSPSYQVKPDGTSVFVFAFKETVKQVKNLKNYSGIDIGIIKPFVSTITNEDGAVLNTVESDQDLYTVNRKISTNWEQIKELNEKIERRKALGLASPLLEQEILFKKRSILNKKHHGAKESARQAVLHARKHNAVIGMENLGFVGNKSGKWVRGQTQKWIKHFANKTGLPVINVDAAYTSHTCPECLTTNTKLSDRDVVCESCDKRTDRDVAASIEISRRCRDKVKATPKQPKKKKKKTRVAGVIHSPRTNITYPCSRRVGTGLLCSSIEQQWSVIAHVIKPINRFNRFY